jgi:hypothetical protein
LQGIETRNFRGSDKLTLSTTSPSVNDEINAHWRRWLLLIWLLIASALIAKNWPNIQYFILSDTDDNMRMSQVRAWLNGQGWYDLRQYKMDPPRGADIHWSRLVDIPLAAIIFVLKPIFGGIVAEKVAIAIAPLLPLGVALLGIATAVRRLIAPGAWVFGAALLLCASSTMNMFMPTRIDHHGWQLAFLAIILAGLVDPRRARGGVTVGLATAGSLIIGLEMLPYLAMSGAAVTLRWIIDDTEVRRLRGYAVALGGGTALGFAVFASNANWGPRCDTLSPVWLSVMMLAGALLFLLTLVPTRRPFVRLGLSAVAGGLIAGSVAYFWPQCIGRPEGISPELERLWFQNIREVKPLYEQSFVTAVSTIALPVVSLIGCAWVMIGDRSRLKLWAPIALFSLCSALLCLWQTRAGPAAQLLAVPGVTALAWAVLPPLSRSSSVLVRTLGVVAAFLVISTLAVQIGVSQIAVEKPSKTMAAVNSANASCTTMSSMAPIARMPAATILTFVDLGPRLITITHHKAIAGPYHRNGDAIIDIHHAFGGTPDTAHAVMKKHGATMVLLCPNLSESTIYRTRDPKGFYVQLNAGQVPNWLQPVPLPKGSPFKLWRLIS